jgi:hypothetical protein
MLGVAVKNKVHKVGFLKCHPICECNRVAAFCILAGYVLSVIARTEMCHRNIMVVVMAV